MFGEEQMRCQKYSKDFPEARYELPVLGNNHSKFEVELKLGIFWKIAGEWPKVSQTLTLFVSSSLPYIALIPEESTILHHTGKKFVIVIAASAALFNYDNTQ